MMIKTIHQLAIEVATLRGEALALECHPAESPFPDIEDQVRIMAPALLTTLILEADPRNLDGAESFLTQVRPDSDGVVTIPLPDNFLRLAEVKMSDWKYELRDVSASDSETLAMQYCGVEGIFGNSQRPVALFGHTLSGQRCIKLFSSDVSASLEKALYYPVPQIDSSDTISIPDSLYPSLLNLLTS